MRDDFRGDQLLRLRALRKGETRLPEALSSACKRDSRPRPVPLHTHAARPGAVQRRSSGLAGKHSGPLRGRRVHRWQGFAPRVSVDCSRGKVEKRTCWQTEGIGWFADKGEWPGLKSCCMVKTETYFKKTGKTVVETRFFISSLPEDPAKALRAIRAHWGIEAMHWVLDMEFDTDWSCDSRLINSKPHCGAAGHRPTRHRSARAVPSEMARRCILGGETGIAVPFRALAMLAAGCWLLIA